MTAVTIEPPFKVYVLGRARQKLQAYIQQCPYEVSGFGTVESIHGVPTITDVFLLKQEVSAGHTELDVHSILELLASTDSRGVDSSTLRLWWHSHATLAAYFSPTDEATIATRLDTSPWMVSLVGNHAGDTVARLDVFPTKERPFVVTKSVKLIEMFDPGVLDEASRDIERYVTFPKKPPVRRTVRSKPPRKVAHAT